MIHDTPALLFGRLREEDVLLDTHGGRLPRFPPAPLSHLPNSLGHLPTEKAAAAGFTTHSMQVMHRKRFVPRCPSTQTAAGVKSPYERLLASERMLDDRVGAGASGICRANAVPEAC